MRTTLSIAIATLLAFMPFATAQDTDTAVMTPFNTGIFAANEPNIVGAPLCLGTTDPSDCAIDANGIDVALEGGAAVRILQAWWSTSGANTNRVVESFDVADDFIVGAGTFAARYGMWSDLNQDGLIDIADQSQGDPAFVVNADVTGRHAQCDNVPTVNPGGNDGQRINVDDSNDVDDDTTAPVDPSTAGPEANTGISNRCDTPQEFVGIPGVRVVMYVTPGDFNDWVNGPLGVETGGTVTPGSTQPDFIMGDASNSADTQNAADGAYTGPSAGFPQVWTDNGLLQTTLTETIAEPDFTPAGSRSYNANNGQSVDADAYKAVNPAVETLYAGSLGGLWYSSAVAGFNPDGGWAAAAQRNAVLTILGPTAGPTIAGIAPPMAQDYPDGYDHSAYVGTFGPYMNVFLNSAMQYNPGVALAADADSVYDKGSMYFGVYGHIGGWWDKNNDGWIGEANSDACGPHACGAVQDPNRYYTAKSNGEFFESAAYNNDGEHFYEFDVTMTPDSPGAAWGDTGIYVLADRYSNGVLDGFNDENDPVYYQDWNQDSNRDNLGGKQYSFNPWDDAAFQTACWATACDSDADGRFDGDHNGNGVADNSEATMLIASGAITVHMVATTYSGTPFYSSYEHFILPGGNLGYDIEIQTESVKYDVAGTILLVDTDVYPAV